MSFNITENSANAQKLEQRREDGTFFTSDAPAKLWGGHKICSAGSGSYTLRKIYNSITGATPRLLEMMGANHAASIVRKFWSHSSSEGSISRDGASSVEKSSVDSTPGDGIGVTNQGDKNPNQDDESSVVSTPRNSASYVKSSSRSSSEGSTLGDVIDTNVTNQGDRASSVGSSIPSSAAAATVSATPRAAVPPLHGAESRANGGDENPNQGAQSSSADSTQGDSASSVRSSSEGSTKLAAKSSEPFEGWDYDNTGGALAVLASGAAVPPLHGAESRANGGDENPNQGAQSSSADSTQGASTSSVERSIPSSAAAATVSATPRKVHTRSDADLKKLFDDGLLKDLNKSSSEYTKATALLKELSTKTQPTKEITEKLAKLGVNLHLKYNTNPKTRESDDEVDLEATLMTTVEDEEPLLRNNS